MANNAAQFVVDTYKADLGGLPKTDALLYWTGKIQSGEMTEAEVKAAIQGSPEGIAYAETGVVDPDRAAVTEPLLTLLVRKGERKIQKPTATINR